MAENDWRNGNVQTEQRREHAVEQRVASHREQNDERKFDRHVKRLLRVAPPAHRRAVKSRAQHDHADVQPESPGAPLLRPGRDRFQFAAQQQV